MKFHTYFLAYIVLGLPTAICTSLKILLFCTVSEFTQMKHRKISVGFWPDET